MAPCEFVGHLPVGFKFRPRDDELLGYYLLNKVRVTSFVDESVIPEVDLYGKIEPWDIWNEYGGRKLATGEDLYFFTKLKSLSGKDSRVARSIGSGTWKGENSGTNVDDRTRNHLGMWKRFHYENPKSDQDGCWIMHEYSLEPLVKPKQNSTSDDHQFVLCRIRKNDKKKRKLRADETHETRVQSHNKRQTPQQVTSLEQLIGNYIPMPGGIGVGGSVSYWPTGLTESQPDYSLACSTNMVSSLARADYNDDVSKFHVIGAADCDALSRDLDTAQPFTEEALGSYAVYNEEKTTSYDESHYTQQGLTENNIGVAITEEIGCHEFGIENTQVNALDFSIDYDLLLHLIDDDDDDPLHSSTAQFRGMGMENNTTTASTEAN